MKYIFFFSFFIAFMSCESKEKQLKIKQEASVEVGDYNKTLRLVDEKKYDSDTVNAVKFGVKADYNGKTGTDNTKSLQIAIDYCSKNNKVLLLPEGRILVNSYGLTPSAKTHANILEIKSNTKIIGNHSEFVLGKNFHDKPFVLLSGLNAVNTKDFKNLRNIEIKNIIFNFNSQEVFMVTQYQLMRGIELGQCMNGVISNCTFINGDLTSAIVTGQGNRDVSSNIKIYNNKFINLIKSPKNEDHTSVYLNSQNSSIYNNTFDNISDQGKIVACAGELHNSNTSFYGNEVRGYLRMNFIAAASTENHNITNIEVHNNTAYITSAAVYLWTDDNTTISNLKIYDNKIFSSHINGYSMSFNGTQGIVADATVGKNTLIQDISILNNQTSILKTNIKGRAVNFMFDKGRKFKNFKEENNSCTGCKDGKYYDSGFKWPF